jgi:GNAT superfamily N-acetyltransferase
MSQQTALADGYVIREATLADIPALVHHRLAMFAEMGIHVDELAIDRAFATWLKANLPLDTYKGWLVDDSDGRAVAGAGITLLPWPPGPRELSGRLPIVYNVFTEPDHRRHGLARMLMERIHQWCRESGHRVVGLAASAEGRSLYESLGYRESPQPYMFLKL